MTLAALWPKEREYDGTGGGAPALAAEQTCGWFSAEIAFASRPKRARNEASAASSGGRTLALRRHWGNLIRRVYEVDPLVCPRCGSEMRVIGFITEPGLIKRILDHIRKRDRASRAPPRIRPPVAEQPAARPA